MVLKIQDKEYLLKYDVNALVLLEDMTGVTLESLVANGLGFGGLRTMLYVGLRKHHTEISLEATGDLIQSFLDAGQEPGTLGEILFKAFKDANLLAKKK